MKNTAGAGPAAAAKGKAMTRKVTIREVAERAGVSIATVSRVINGTSRVEPETVARVERAVRETGYYPDAIARTMRRNQSFVIGLLIDDLSNHHFTTIAKAIEDVIRVKGYNLLVSSSNANPQIEVDNLKTFMSKKMDGLIVHSAGGNERLIAELSNQVPAVLVYRKVRDTGFFGDFVGSEDYDGAYRLAKHLLERGHRRIAVVNGDLSISTGAERFAGFMAALEREGVRIPESSIFRGNYLFESGVAGAGALMRGRKRPTALAALSNNLALGVLAYLRENGFAVPGDVSFASFGDISNRELLYIKPTIVEQNPREIGRAAGELLLARIAEPDRTPEEVLIPSPIVEGGSVARLE